MYFRDKGPTVPVDGGLSESSPAWLEAEALISPRAQLRRAKTLPQSPVLDARDAPVFRPYLEEITRLGGLLQRESRWLNAASYLLTPQQRQRVQILPFVERIAPVVVFHRREVQLENAPRLSHTDSLYGSSFGQNNMIGATKVHAMGITGRGVLVGMLDTGFRWRTHEALQSAQVVDEYDFIQNDRVTENQAGDSPNQDEHGTLTMSILGGSKPGQLIGPAYGVQFLLGKTEYVPTETRIEEDNWVAGIEWMESQGVDIVSSSLGYDNFDNGFGYRWENGDFDGRTAVTTRAAARAAQLGVLVCSAVGNEGNGDGVRGTLLTPADAAGTLAVGAVTFGRSLAWFSSTGPTNDGRIKPDMVGPGVHVYGAGTSSATAYTFADGTSTSTPLVAASAALLLSARPDLTAPQVRSALLSTADTVNMGDPRSASRPNNFTGWGLANAYNAILSVGPVFSNEPSLAIRDSLNVVTTVVVSKSGLLPDGVTLYYSSVSSSGQAAMVLDSSMFFPTSGRYRFTFPPMTEGTSVRFYIEARDSSGRRYASPSEYSGFRWEFQAGATSICQRATAFRLMQNYPNPFIAQTSIRFDAPDPVEGSVVIYNVLGQRVRTLYSGIFSSNMRPLIWNGTDDDGRPLPSGVYFYVARTPLYRADRKMLLLRQQ